jgi:hypothetical protein
MSNCFTSDVIFLMFEFWSVELSSLLEEDTELGVVAEILLMYIDIFNAFETLAIVKY